MSGSGDGNNFAYIAGTEQCIRRLGWETVVPMTKFVIAHRRPMQPRATCVPPAALNKSRRFRRIKQLAELAQHTQTKLPVQDDRKGESLSFHPLGAAARGQPARAYPWKVDSGSHE